MKLFVFSELGVFLCLTAYRIFIPLYDNQEIEFGSCQTCAPSLLALRRGIPRWSFRAILLFALRRRTAVDVKQLRMPYDSRPVITALSAISWDIASNKNKQKEILKSVNYNGNKVEFLTVL